MRIVTYNFRRGGGPRRSEHWARLRRQLKADVLLTQESKPPPEPERHRTALWAEAAQGWGTGLYAPNLTVKPMEVKGFHGWVMGGEVEGLPKALRIFSLHCPAGRGGYAATVHRILDRFQAMPGEAELVIGGDFNVVAGVRGPDEPVKISKAEREVLARLTGELGLIPCWQTANPGLPLAQTLRWVGKPAAPYHCDGIFIPRAWQARLDSCKVFATEDWLALSDHNPVLAVLRESKWTRLQQTPR